jgi:hypothetical protein
MLIPIQTTPTQDGRPRLTVGLPVLNVLDERARTPLSKWAAHDDVLEASYLGRCVEALDEDGGAILAHTRTNVIDQSGALKRSCVNPLNEERGVHQPPRSTMVQRDDSRCARVL